MCTKPKIHEVSEPITKPIATPTYADADVQKAGATERNRVQGLANRNIKTTTRGLGEDVPTDKKRLLGE